MKHWMWFILCTFLCCSLDAMTFNSLGKNNIFVRLNIGGCKIMTTRQTVEKWGGVLLSELIDDIFSADIDEEGFTFIDRDPKEGELLRSFMQARTLPTDYDENIANTAATYFDNEAMKKFLAEQKNMRASKKTHWSQAKVVHFNSRCNECEKYECRALTSCILHLINSHASEIIHVSSNKVFDKHRHTQNFFEIVYKVPEINS